MGGWGQYWNLQSKTGCSLCPSLHGVSSYDMDNQGTLEFHMERNVRDLLNLYNPNDPLDHAWTIPSPWYFDPGVGELEQQSVFAKTWQMVGRADQVKDKGSFFTADLAGEPIVVARGDDGQ